MVYFRCNAGAPRPVIPHSVRRRRARELPLEQETGVPGTLPHERGQRARVFVFLEWRVDGSLGGNKSSTEPVLEMIVPRG